MMDAKATIIPIASGKGGVGKTFLTANLAIAIAEMGHSTVAVDMDLGGSNLYSFLGLPNRFPGIGDFLKARSAELEELLVATEISNLKLLPGDGVTPFMANIPHAHKIRLLSRIVKLPAEYILLDLGAGTSYNTLDSFRLSSHGLVITTPENPSVMNMLAFLKQFLLRVIEGNLAKNQYIRDLLQSLYKRPITDQKMNMEALRSKIAAIDHEAGETVAALCNKIRPRVVFNMGQDPKEIKIAEQINHSLRKNLSIEADYFGFVFADPTVLQSIKERAVFLPRCRDSMAAETIQRIAERVVKFWDRPVENSALLLLSHASKVYESRAKSISAFSHLRSHAQRLMDPQAGRRQPFRSALKLGARLKGVGAELLAEAKKLWARPKGAGPDLTNGVKQPANQSEGVETERPKGARPLGPSFGEARIDLRNRATQQGDNREDVETELSNGAR
jgi:flagellar biosynthesis protein FlhG